MGEGVSEGGGVELTILLFQELWLHTEESFWIMLILPFPKPPFDQTTFALFSALLFSPNIAYFSKAPPPNCLKSKR